VRPADAEVEWIAHELLAALGKNDGAMGRSACLSSACASGHDRAGLDKSLISDLRLAEMI